MPRNQGTSRKGKPNKRDREAGMGRALQKAQGQRHVPKRNGRNLHGQGMIMQEGVQSLGLADVVEENTKSVLEIRDLDDFLLQAEMANREFASEKEGLVVLDASGQLYRGPTLGEGSTYRGGDTKKASDFVYTELSVPRRPPWNEKTTPQELEINEKQAFLEWRRAIAYKEEELTRSQSTIAATPFEKNLEVWRQLWRVLERSACLLQLVDARNPLFYLSDDLRQYATALGKPMMVLINKSDFLSSKQRAIWRDYLLAKGWDPVFFSAALEQDKLDKAAQKRRREEIGVKTPKDGDDLDHDLEHDDSSDDEDEQEELVSEDGHGVDVPLNRKQLMETMLRFAKQSDCKPDPRYDNRIQFGMVGFPNVGKSSVINVLMGNSKHTHGQVRVAVAPQPGKTKHFQTLLLPDSEEMMLCDCPGLVFPSFVSNTADLIAAGVYPISQMRDHWPVVSLIAQRIPREIIDALYGIELPTLTEQELREQYGGTNKQPPPTAEEFLSTLCVARGMLASSSGVPDFPRGARMVIKDYAVGKLLYCHPPPTIAATEKTLTQFYRETVDTALLRTEYLKAKLEKLERRAKKRAPATTMTATTSESKPKEEEKAENGDDAAVEVDDDMLEFLGATARPSKGNTTANGQSKTSKKKGGRKKKGRNEDPYGCHSSPDDMLGEAVAIRGVSVKGGAKQSLQASLKGYTRPTGHGFTVPAVN